MVQRFLFIILLFLIFSSPLWASTTYYVAKTGNDTTGDGSSSKPWLTITKGVSVLVAGDTLSIKAGTYREMVILTKSGTAALPITIQAFPGDEGNVIISAAEVITGWTQCTSAGDCYGNPNWADIYYTDVPESVVNLFQNNTKLISSRYPNTASSFLYPSSVSKGYLKTIFYDSDLGKTDDYFNGSICTIKTYPFAIDQIPVSDYVSSTGEITLSSFARYDIKTGFGYYFTNIVAEINSEGEWAYRGGRIFIYPINGDLTHIEVGARDYCFSIPYNVKYNTIKKLVMRYAKINGVRLNAADNNRIESNTIQYAYDTGISITDSQSTVIIDNTIQYSNNNGIFVHATSSNAVIEYNAVLNTGASAFGDDLIYGYGIGILTRGAGGTIKYNRIDKTGYCGIQHQGDRGRKYISNNYITNVCLSLTDGGAIYTIGPSSTGVYDYITYNIVTDIYGYYGGVAGKDATLPYDSSGIYLDEQANAIELRNNTVYNSPHFGIFLHWARDIIIADNTVYGCAHSQIYISGSTNAGNATKATGITLSGNILYCTARSQRCLTIWSEGYVGSDFGNSNNNLYISNNADIIWADDVAGDHFCTLAEWTALHGDDTTSVDWTEFLAAYPDALTTFQIIINPTLVATTPVLAAGNYYDVYGMSYTDNITLQPYTSIVLIKRKDQSTGYTLATTAQNGTVTVSSNKASYLPGEIVTLTATPATWYTFGGWTGGAIGKASPFAITMNANTTVSAFFTNFDPLLTEIKDELAFDSVTNYQSISTGGWAPSQGSVSMWINPSTTTSAIQFLFGHTTGSSSNLIQLYLTDGNLTLGLGDSATIETNIAPIAPEQWHCVSLAWDNGIYTIYVNGLLKGTGTYSGLTQLNTFADIGNTGNMVARNEGFLGKIGNTRIYNRSLTAAEIREVYYTFDGKENWLSLVNLLPYDLTGNPATFLSKVTGLPKRARFDPATNILLWRPWYDQSGTYELLFSSVGSDFTQKVTLNVENIRLKSWYQSWIEDSDILTAMVEY